MHQLLVGIAGKLSTQGWRIKQACKGLGKVAAIIRNQTMAIGLKPHAFAPHAGTHYHGAAGCGQEYFGAQTCTGEHRVHGDAAGNLGGRLRNKAMEDDTLPLQGLP